MTYSGDYSQAQPVRIAGNNSTSYFSMPSDHLDPILFSGNAIRPWVKNSILSLLMDHLAKFYEGPDRWAKAWLAGSGVSYQWQAQRSPSDLDCLVGVDYIEFRRLNPSYRGLSDSEISEMMNEELKEHLMPSTENWQNEYELTFYVNPGATDITAINPYAAYDLSDDCWTVEPSHTSGAGYSREWEKKADLDLEMTKNIVGRYSAALSSIKMATNPSHRVNAEANMRLALSQASSLFDEIHSNRHIAFSRVGAGYADFNNWRWQAGKRSGAVPVLKTLRDYERGVKTSQEVHTYGMELPRPDLLIRRAAVYRD